MSDKAWLGENGVRVALQGHLSFQASIKAVYDTMKALRDGVAPGDLRDTLASADLIAQVTRKDDYDQQIAEYLR